MTKEEAIKVIKDWNLNNDKIEVLSVIIPELKESEDEKIRKQLLNWFKDCNWDAIDNGTLKRDDIITWLEKQGKQKSEEVDNLHNYLYSEQKPADITDEWIEEYWQHEKVNNPYSYNKGDEIQFDYQGFVSFCKKYCQNPAWSEEDKENISMLIDLVESKEESMEVKIELSAWLKSIKEKMQPQPKPTWSEEDEERYVSCLQRLGTGNLKQPETINTVWLKSLKERVQLV